MMGAMLGSFLHTIRNPIHRLSTTLDVICHPKFDLREVPAYAEEMTRAVERLASICRDITLFAAPEGASIEELDLNETARKSLMEANFEDRAGIECRLQLAEPALAVRGNRVQLEQCMKLIISNALEAMPDGGELVIETGARDGAMVRFRDTGIGMDPVTKARCFEPFFTTKGPGGTGLGLSMAFGIMKRHKGIIEIESQPGAGTTVTLVFPKEEELRDAEDTDRG